MLGLIFFIAAMSALLYLSYNVLGRDMGKKEARNIILFFLSVTFCMGAGIVLFQFLFKSSTTLRDSLLLGLTLLVTISCWWPLLSAFWRKTRGGSILIYLGRPNLLEYYLFGFSTIPLAYLFFLATGFSDGVVTFAVIFTTFSIAVNLLYRGSAPLEIKEAGVQHAGGFIPWERINGFGWRGEADDILSIKVAGVLPRTISWPIPLDLKDKVERTLLTQSIYAVIKVPSRRNRPPYKR